jgi:hypothetical protein
MNHVLGQFYAGMLFNPRDDLQMEIKRYEEIIEEWGDVYPGDQGYQDDLMTHGALIEALDEIDMYYDDDGNYIYGI